MTEEQNKLAEEIERCLKYLSVRHFKHDAEIHDVLTRCHAALRREPQKPTHAAANPAGIAAFQKVCDDIGLPVPTEEEAKAFYAFAGALIKHDEAKAGADREPAIEAVLALIENLVQARAGGLALPAYETGWNNALYSLQKALKGKGASQGAKPCPLCGRTDAHSHTSGPMGMS